VAAYFLGSVPFGLVLTEIAGLGDIRKIGSGNIGATNVLRTGNKALAAATLLLDGGKGAVAVLVARSLYGPEAAIVAGGAALLGHMFPVWLKFRGGKGVATGLGVLLAIAWPVGLIACGVWLLAAAVFRYSSLAALLAVAAAPVASWFLADRQIAGLALFLAVFVWLRHHENIRRLLTGRESRIRLGGSKGTAA
jgi:glycerol-3-phosphate acyltransferase PlsY